MGSGIFEVEVEMIVVYLKFMTLKEFSPFNQQWLFMLYNNVNDVYSFQLFFWVSRECCKKGRQREKNWFSCYNDSHLSVLSPVSFSLNPKDKAWKAGHSLPAKALFPH